MKKFALIALMTLATVSAHCGDYFSSLEFLYMKPAVDGLEFGVEQTIGFGGSGAQITAENDDLSYKWNPGFRIEIGNLSPSQWDLSLGYTFLYGSADGSLTSPNQNTFINIAWFPDTLGGVATQANAKWNCDVNRLDLVLGKPFSIGDCFSLRPMVGLRGASIIQHYRAKYGAIFVSMAELIVLAPFNSKLKFRQQFGGAGIHAGCDFLWNFSSSWSFYSGVAGSLMYGQFSLKEEVFGAFFVDAGGTPALITQTGVLREKYCRVRTDIEAEIGVRCLKYLYHRPIEFSISYQIYSMFGQNEFINLLSSFDNQLIGDGFRNSISSVAAVRKGTPLTFQGIKIGGEISF